MQRMGSGARRSLASVVVAGAVGLGSLIAASPAAALPPAGTISTVVGGFGVGPANSIAQSPGPIVGGPGGVVYLSDLHAQGVREIDADGIEQLVVGVFPPPVALAVGPGGDLAMTDAISQTVQAVAAQDCTAGNCPFGYPGAMTKGDKYVVAGTGATTTPGNGGPAIDANLFFPQAVAVDSAGDLVIADTSNGEIRVVAAADCAAAPCAFGYPGTMTKGDVYDIADASAIDVAVDPQGDLVFHNGGAINVLAGSSCPATTCPYGITGAMTAGQIYAIPSGLSQTGALAVNASGDIAVSNGGGLVYGIARSDCTVACPFGFPGPMTAGTATVVAGDNSSADEGDGIPATSAQLSTGGVAVDSSGDLLVTSVVFGTVRLVAASSCTSGSCPFGFAGAMIRGDIYTIAGAIGTEYTGEGGPAANAQLIGPSSVLTDSGGDVVVNEEFTGVDFSNNRVVVAAGATCAAGSCPFGYPDAMTQGDIYTVAGGGTTGYVDGGPAVGTTLAGPGALAIDALGDLAIADPNNSQILVVAASSCTAGNCPFGFPGSMTRGHIYLLAGGNGPGFPIDGVPAASTQFAVIGGLTVDSAGNLLVADGGAIRLIAAASCQAGTCPFNFAGAMTKGDVYSVAGTGNTPGFAGDGGPATSAQMELPHGLGVDAAGDIIEVEAFNFRARLVAGASCDAGSCPFGFPDAMTRGDIYTIAGDGDFTVSGDGGPATAAGLGVTAGMAIDPLGDLLISSASGNVVRLVANASCTAGACPFGIAGPMTAGDIYTVAGTGTDIFNGDGIPAVTARLGGPSGLALDGNGNLLIADVSHGRVRAVSGQAFAPVTVGAPSASTTYGHIPTLTPTGYASGVAPLTSATCSTTATTTSPPGNYPVTCSGAIEPGETFTSTTGMLTVTKAPLTVTASSPTIAPGDPIPSITASYSGFVNGETAAGLTTAPTCSTTATHTSGVGSYPTVCTGAVDSNYAISYVPGTLTIAVPDGSGGSPPPPHAGVTNPTITAKVSSATPKRHGWFRSPVTITYHCVAGSAALVGPCPRPVTLRHGGADQTVTSTITATDGGMATLTVTVRIDRTAPYVVLKGVEDGHTYQAGHGPHPRCTANDGLSGLAAPCRLTRKHHDHGGFRNVRYVATASDKAGNVTTLHGGYRIRLSS